MHVWRPEDNDWGGRRPTTWVLVIELGSSCLMTSALTPFKNYIYYFCGGGAGVVYVDVVEIILSHLRVSTLPLTI